MRNGYLIGVLLIVAVLVACAIGYQWVRSPTLVNQTSFEPIIDPAENPRAYLCRLTFREENGRAWHYAVVTYGRTVRLEPGPGSFTVLVDGTSVEVAPADGGLWAIGPDLQLHRLGLPFQDVSKGFERGGGGAFLEGSLWKDRLKPMLEQYRWQEH
jgi:hypothetical protein